MTHPEPHLTPHNGFSLHTSSALAGGKRAVIQGDRLYVSPAMYDLISHAEGDELKRLLSHIECVQIPEMDFSMPMTTTRPGPGDSYA